MNTRLLKTHAPLSTECLGILRRAMTRFDMSARAYDRIIRISRTIADLDGSAAITPAHISEAISYRSLDRSSWGSAYL